MEFVERVIGFRGIPPVQYAPLRCSPCPLDEDVAALLQLVAEREEMEKRGQKGPLPSIARDPKAAATFALAIQKRQERDKRKRLVLSDEDKAGDEEAGSEAAGSEAAGSEDPGSEAAGDAAPPKKAEDSAPLPVALAKKPESAPPPKKQDRASKPKTPAESALLPKTTAKRDRAAPPKKAEDSAPLPVAPAKKPERGGAQDTQEHEARRAGQVGQRAQHGPQGEGQRRR